MPSLSELPELIPKLKPSVVRINVQSGSGSGFVVHKDGYVVTNAHVVKESERARVELFDGRSLRGDVVVALDDADLALVKIVNTQDLRAAPLGDSDRVKDGAAVFALGFPLGSILSGGVTTTEGIISARRILENVENFQTNAALNPGNSGGPLFDMNSKVVGVTTSVRRFAQDGRPVEGVGFAIVSNEVRKRLRAYLPDLFTPKVAPAPDIMTGAMPVSPRMALAGNPKAETPTSDKKPNETQPPPSRVEPKRPGFLSTQLRLRL